MLKSYFYHPDYDALFKVIGDNNYEHRDGRWAMLHLPNPIPLSSYKITEREAINIIQSRATKRAKEKKLQYWLAGTIAFAGVVVLVCVLVYYFKSL